MFPLENVRQLSLSDVFGEMWIDWFAWIRLMLEQHLEITAYYYSFLVRFCIFMSRCSFLICVCIVMICKFGVRDVLEIRLK